MKIISKIYKLSLNVDAAQFTIAYESLQRKRVDFMKEWWKSFKSWKDDDFSWIFEEVHVFFFVHRSSPRPFSCAFSTNIHSKRTPASVRKVPVLEVCDKVSLLSKIVHICISLHGQASAQQRQNDMISDNILWYFSLFCKIKDTLFFVQRHAQMNEKCQ